MHARHGVANCLSTHAGDAAWLARYALSREGTRVPWELVEKSLRATHPYAVFAVRSMLSVPFFEKALYELPEVCIAMCTASPHKPVHKLLVLWQVCISRHGS